ncbi:hypothetical protein HMPREF9406_0708 [Clostridium sp. HGF2]|nr:hypothetical protein HMPREF9406_0708 [Clostridium sp. HGF2]EQJ58661.1 hypothetical protein QSI_1943 [Clostridioides difficile P28]
MTNVWERKSRQEDSSIFCHAVHIVNGALCELHNFLTNTRKIYENAV